MLIKLLLFIFTLNITTGVIHAETQKTINTSKHGQDFNPQMVYLVDQGNGTYLFRGNMPQLTDVFAYTELTSCISSILGTMNITLSDNYNLIDLSFLNYKNEEVQIEVEKEWFLQNPSSGSFLLKSLYGTIFNPLDFPCKIRDLYVCHRDVDHLKSLMPQIKNLLDTQYETDCVIYMHCNAGIDRTGEASACYLMQYKGVSYEDAVALNYQIAGRDVLDKPLNAIRWYAFYLREILGIKTIGSINGK